MKFGFHPAAEVEHLEQVAYYEAQQVGLGQRYLEQVEHAIDRMCDSPEMYRVERAPGIRRVAISGFPFHLIFHQRGEIIQILAVAPHRRRPSYWLPRL